MPRSIAPIASRLSASLALAAAAALLCACAGDDTATPDQSGGPLAIPILAHDAPTAPVSPSDVAGRFVLILGDADMARAAPAALPRPGAAPASPLFTRSETRDTLTVIGLPIADAAATAQRWSTRVAQVPVPSSSLGPPGPLALTPDRQRAYVVSSFLLDDATSTITPGDSITPIDLRDPIKPAALPPLRVGRAPVSVDVHPTLPWVAVATAQPGQQIVMLRAGDEATKPLAFPLVGIEDEAAEPGAMAWHPTGRYLAITLPALDTIALYEVAIDPKTNLPALAPWGDPIRLPAAHPAPAAIKFTPDGRTLLVTTLGQVSTASALADAGGTPALVAIRLSTVPSESTTSGKAAGIAIDHDIASTQPLGAMPEALAISPDGTTIAVASRARVMLFDPPARSPADARGTLANARGGELAIITINPNTSELTTHTRWPLSAIPTAVAFDARGRHILLTQLPADNPAAIDGSLAILRLDRRAPKPAQAPEPTRGPGSPPADPRATGAQPPKTSPPPTPTYILVPADFAVGTGPGPHAMILVR
jgi:DNA-binding beta-propeller fold protein YncE